MPFAPTITDSADLTEVRGHLRDAAQHVIEQRRRPADEHSTDDFREEVRSAVDFINSFDPVERALAAAERTRPEPGNGGQRGPESFGADLDRESRSPGSQVTESEAYQEWVASGGQRAFPNLEVRTLLSSVSEDGGVFRPVGTPELLSQTVVARRPFLRQLMSVQQTGLSSVPYIRETSPLTNEWGATAVAEASAKPEVTMAFEQYDAPVRKIAGWVRATDEIVMDAPTLRGYIDTRLAYMVMIREEQQVLAGTGSAPQIEGLDQVSDTQSQSTPTGDYPGIIGRAIGKIENTDGDADGVATNPLDYWLAVTSRYAEQFDNGFGGNAPAAASGVTWGLPAVRTRALTAGTAWVGSWRLGSSLLERQGTVIRTADQHDDLFIKNQIVILAEERVACAWHRPDWFVKCTVPAGS